MDVSHRHRRQRLLRHRTGDPAASRKASRTSSSSSAATASAAPGATTRIPGCACDVPSHLYSFSFAPNPDWTRTYSRQPEIRAYLRRVAARRDAADPAEREVSGAPGTRRRSAGCSIRRRAGPRAGAGLRHRAAGRAEDPGLPGAATSRARRFIPPAGITRATCAASASRRRDRRVGDPVVPAIAPEVAQLYVLQRTPPWVMPHSARAICVRAAALPAPSRRCSVRVRGGIYTARELIVLGFVKHPRAMRLLEQVARRHMARSVAGSRAAGAR